MKILHDPIQKEKLIQTHKLADYMTLDIHEISDLVCFARNEYLVTAGVPSDYLYFVMSGKTICFSYTTNEKNNCVSFTQHQTLMGEASSLFGKPPPFNVKALSDTEPMQVDDLTELVDIPTRRVLSALTVLEIDQYVVQHAGKHYTRAVTLTE